ncbi:aldo/keto reductase [Coraliomargarita parva]|uniref:aldo/keto reductase n=1 Tax=Coraliomargarita parva TaxID=3014050 RepID=UPI0022B2CB3B|nr:aldo/keto reductase [Coraliomargarita parva]
MKYRRFGRTGLELSVFSLGGMRFPRGWEKGLTYEGLTDTERETIAAILDRSFDCGINHIETARGYGHSEDWFRLVLGAQARPRDSYYLQTKVAPKADPKEFEKTLQESFDSLGCDYLDLFGFHGINEQQELDWIIRPGGCLEVVRRWQKDGRIRHVGFSTHGACEVIVKAIECGEFEYVNLHWYYINQTNWAAIEAATRQDMGVFIISPTDKGGQLFAPPQKLSDACAPLHPITFNDLFCLRRPEVHTLSVGAGQASDFDEHLAALAYYDRIDGTIAPIEARLEAVLQDALGADWWPSYSEGLPWYTQVPGEVNLPYILRLWSLAKGLDMTGYGKYRYGMIEGGDGGNWMGGKPSGEFDEPALLALLKDHPHRDRIPGILREAHAMFKGEAKQRLSSD